MLIRSLLETPGKLTQLSPKSIARYKWPTIRVCLMTKSTALKCRVYVPVVELYCCDAGGLFPVVSFTF